jgi:hypothetical protein
MNEHIEHLMYEAGLTAQGCWDRLDDYDRAAIEKLVELVAKDCALIAGLMEYDGRKNIGAQILDTFGVE